MKTKIGDEELERLWELIVSIGAESIYKDIDEAIDKEEVDEHT